MDDFRSQLNATIINVAYSTGAGSCVAWLPILNGSPVSTGGAGRYSTVRVPRVRLPYYSTGGCYDNAKGVITK